MTLWDLPPLDVRPVVTAERAELLNLLATLTPQHWAAATGCPGWTVKDIALHILQGDLGTLARGRDNDTASLLTGFDDYRAFVAALNAQNQRWIEATRSLSGRLIRELLAFAGNQMAAYWASVELDAQCHVSWAGPDPVPRWFGIAQEFTEHWVHQQQIRVAVGIPGLVHNRFLGTVLSTFAWALPHHYRTVTGPDVEVSIRFAGEGGSVWSLTRQAGHWDLHQRPARNPAATITVPTADAWRLFTGALDDHHRVRLDGDATLTHHFLTTRSIIV